MSGNIGNGMGNTIGNMQHSRSEAKSTSHVANVANISKDFCLLAESHIGDLA